MFKVDTIKDGKWKRLNISDQEIEKRVERYIGIIDKMYPNLKPIKVDEYKRLRDLYISQGENALEEIIEKTLKYVLYPVAHVYARYSIKSFEFEDAVNSAILIYRDLLLSSNISFPEKKDDFIVFLNRKIVHRLKREDQRNKRHNIQVYIDCEHIGDEIKDEFVLQDIDEKVFKEDVAKIIKRIYNQLSESDKQIFDKLFVERHREYVVAKLLNISRETVNQTKKSIRRLLLRKLAYELRYVPKEYEFGGINPYED